jgi:hypothetical protein
LCQPKAAPTKSKGKLSPKNERALRALNECLLDLGTPTPASTRIPAGATIVALEQWRDLLLKNGTINRDGSYRQEFQRIQDKLTLAGRIGIWDGRVWIP